MAAPAATSRSTMRAPCSALPARGSAAGSDAAGRDLLHLRRHGELRAAAAHGTEARHGQAEEGRRRGGRAAARARVRAAEVGTEVQRHGPHRVAAMAEAAGLAAELRRAARPRRARGAGPARPRPGGGAAPARRPPPPAIEPPWPLTTSRRRAPLRNRASAVSSTMPWSSGRDSETPPGTASKKSSPPKGMGGSTSASAPTPRPRARAMRAAIASASRKSPIGACGPWVSRLPIGRMAQAPAREALRHLGRRQLGDAVATTAQASMSSAARLSACTPRPMQRSSGW